MPTDSHVRWVPPGLVGAIGLALAALSPVAHAADFLYTVQPGDHPWNLAQRYLRTPTLAHALRQRNRIPDDLRILPGTQLRIPAQWLKLESVHITLVATTGDTTLQQGQTSARAAVAGETLNAPSDIRTGSDGSATLQLANGSRILVRRDSEVHVQTSQTSVLGKASIVALSLVKGSVENEVTPATSGIGRFEIRTPAAIAAVRGTRYRVTADGLKMRTEVLEGGVEVANAQGQVTAQAGQGTQAERGSGPVAPVVLLAAPRLDDLPDKIERLPITWPIAALDRARGYRTQVSATPEFSALLSDEVADTARIRVRDINDGSYFVRVRGIDAQGLEGIAAQRKLVIHTQPEPPLLIEPAPDSATPAIRPTLRWTQGEASLQYRVEIRHEGAGTQQIVQEQIVETPYAQLTQDLVPGKYQWRVAAIHPAKGQGPWGDLQLFRRVLPGPGVNIPPPQEGRVTLRWTAQPQTTHYQIQVARGTLFNGPFVDVRVDAPQHTLNDLSPGAHHVRVRATGTDGYTGPWGSTQAFIVPEPPPSPWPGVLILLIPLLAIL